MHLTPRLEFLLDELYSGQTRPRGGAHVFRNTCKTMSSPLLWLGRANSVWTLFTRLLLLQDVSTRQPVESRESFWLEGKLTGGRVRCQSACGNVSRSICWLVPTGQKGKHLFCWNKHSHLKMVADETIIWHEVCCHLGGWSCGLLSPAAWPLRGLLL